MLKCVPYNLKVSTLANRSSWLPVLFYLFVNCRAVQFLLEIFSLSYCLLNNTYSVCFLLTTGSDNEPRTQSRTSREVER